MGAAILVCAAVTLGLGIYPTPLLKAVQAAVPRRDLLNPPVEVGQAQDLR